jgi:Zn-dependent M28 family amino/carboxypeptidase
MRFPHFCLVAAILLFTSLFAGASFAFAQTGPATEEAAGKQWWAHVQYLASDAMRGRQTGSPEFLKAAEYVVAKFKADGLEPAGVDGGWYQPVHFDVQRVLAAQSSVRLIVRQDGRDGPPAALRLGDDLILGTRLAQPKSIHAPLVFIGYGLHLPEAKYDDFDSPEVPLASLKGKIVVYLNGGPSDLPGPLKSYARTAPFIKAARDAGVVGLIAIPTPKSMDFGWQRIASSASQPGMRLAAMPDAAALAARHPALADDHGELFTATFNPANAEQLFAGSGHTFAELLTLADAQKPLPRFELGKQIEATISTEISHVESPNIAARLPGSGPQLKDQYVIISAHLDHLGVGAPIHGKTIYTGAMDDASGVATVLEVARKFSEARERPRRSILFLIVTAEEKGLLGSRYFAGHPTVPEKQIIADLNLDMFMPIFALKKLHVQGLEQSTLADQAKAVGEAHHIEVAVDPEPDRNSFIRSDQYSFIQAGVPALAFKFGWTAGSPEYKAWRAWLADRYHSPDDDLTQPVDYIAAAQFNDYLADLLRHIADDPAAPHYLDTSFFKRFETAR